MNDTVILQDYARIFLEGIPLLDVRSPGEFRQGAFPTADNQPLLDDAERHAVGLCYKERGEQAAIELGHRLVSGQKRERRIESWLDWHARHPDGRVYCFRGGLRSATVQRWLAEAGQPLPRLGGGYKAMRRFLLESLARTLPGIPIWTLAGRTGCGKTRVIAAMEQAVDLEGHARHRGSAFGRRPGGQPTQIDFENAIAIEFLRLHARQATGGVRPVVLEDESKLIGHRLIPPVLFARMQTAPRVLIEEPMSSRIQVTLEDYIVDPLGEYSRFYGPEQALDRLGAELLAALDRIRNRLGGQRHSTLNTALRQALDEHRRTGSAEVHRDWIGRLLHEYYDPQYDHALRRKPGAAPVFVGRRYEILEFLQERTASPIPADPKAAFG
ncbi:Selenophosphate-dependent tRNA 2-selenouridine synthase [Thioalkalivibrio nitratireducens DSM 14787]|uniref:tRNA 2-selenouridine synthase n=1 Tax=Thioalkalivibrio nitratireducens (strain DSM 14787 / UNIQEM 213 / ALEN2) TaxID=1255043 RepID=L0DVR4_THIND|nr:tRNA 2-selenouridine(34) synthase MnmH [Thioalkalivibrio nitratireducens]AGA33694.1 Selenophosphate-dependent tRNA 2-selenouridine synthase [Thioalkalivibrio nitratireducens DSM 14787]